MKSRSHLILFFGLLLFLLSPRDSFSLPSCVDHVRIVEAEVALQKVQVIPILNSRGNQRVPEEESLGEISIKRNGQSTKYSLMNRSWMTLREWYPQRWRSVEALKGKKVIDIGCGGGQFVLDLKKQGVEIIGTDIFIPPYQQRHLNQIFFQADATYTPFRTNSFDVAYSNFGPLFPELDRKDVRDLLYEFIRITKHGGSIRLYMVDTASVVGELENIPELKIVYRQDLPRTGQSILELVVDKTKQIAPAPQPAPVRLRAPLW